MEYAHGKPYVNFTVPILEDLQEHCEKERQSKKDKAKIHENLKQNLSQVVRERQIDVIKYLAQRRLK